MIDKNFQTALDKVHAEEKLKSDTYSFLRSKIENGTSRPVFSLKKLAVIAASLVLAFFSAGISYNLYFTASAYVDIDVNPSIELTVNQFGKVIAISAYNDESTALINEVNIRHSSIDHAVEELVTTMADKNYLSKNGLLSLTVQTPKGDDSRLISQLKTTVDAILQARELNAEADVFAVTEEIKETSDKCHLSPAKYLAILDLQNVDPTATLENCKSDSISEIKERTRSHCGTDEADDDENSATDHDGCGHH